MKVEGSPASSAASGRPQTSKKAAGGRHRLKQAASQGPDLEATVEGASQEVRERIAALAEMRAKYNAMLLAHFAKHGHGGSKRRALSPAALPQADPPSAAAGGSSASDATAHCGEDELIIDLPNEIDFSDLFKDVHDELVRPPSRVAQLHSHALASSMAVAANAPHGPFSMQPGPAGAPKAKPSQRAQQEAASPGLPTVEKQQAPGAEGGPLRPVGSVPTAMLSVPHHLLYSSNSTPAEIHAHQQGTQPMRHGLHSPALHSSDLMHGFEEEEEMQFLAQVVLGPNTRGGPHASSSHKLPVPAAHGGEGEMDGADHRMPDLRRGGSCGAQALLPMRSVPMQQQQQQPQQQQHSWHHHEHRNSLPGEPDKEMHHHGSLHVASLVDAWSTGTYGKATAAAAQPEPYMSWQDMCFIDSDHAL